MLCTLSIWSQKKGRGGERMWREGAPPVVVDAPGERELLADLRAHAVGERDAREVGLDADHIAAGAERADVHH